MVVPADRLVADAQLSRPGGQPHVVGYLYRTQNETFARGSVRHPDHETIYLAVWHRVVLNAEVQPKPVARPNAEVQPEPVARPVTRLAYRD